MIRHVTKQVISRCEHCLEHGWTEDCGLWRTVRYGLCLDTALMVSPRLQTLSQLFLIGNTRANVHQPWITKRRKSHAFPLRVLIWSINSAHSPPSRWRTPGAEAGSEAHSPPHAEDRPYATTGAYGGSHLRLYWKQWYPPTISPLTHAFVSTGHF